MLMLPASSYPTRHPTTSVSIAHYRMRLTQSALTHDMPITMPEASHINSLLLERPADLRAHDMGRCVPTCIDGHWPRLHAPLEGALWGFARPSRA